MSARKAVRLQHEYPRWETDDDGEERLVWVGHMRIVRSARRARRLRQRGVPLLHVGRGDGSDTQRNRKADGSLERRGPWAWFVE